MNDKHMRKLYELLVKIGYVFFSNFYLFRNGYLINLNIEEPFIIQLEEKELNLFKELIGDFSLIHVTEISLLKKSLKIQLEYQKYLRRKEKTNDIGTWEDFIQNEAKIPYYEAKDQFYHVNDQKEIDQVTELFNNRMTWIGQIENWNKFHFSPDEKENKNLIQEVYTENIYVLFKGEEKDIPSVIVTKSMFPLVNETNIKNLYYAEKKVNNENLYLIIFDFFFDLFRILSFHFFIPISE